MRRMCGDAGEDVGQPGLRIDPVHFGCDDHVVHGCGTPSTAIKSAEQPGFVSKSYASEASLGGVVGGTYAPVPEEESEARPSLQDVVGRLGQIVSAGELGELLAHLDLKILNQGPTEPAPNLETLLRTLAIDRSLDLKQRIDPTHDLDRDRGERK